VKSVGGQSLLSAGSGISPDPVTLVRTSDPAPADYLEHDVTASPAWSIEDGVLQASDAATATDAGADSLDDDAANLASI
jgi:hypothetical protein